MPDLTLQSRDADDVVVIYPRGFINAHTVRHFEHELQRALDSGRVKIVINGSGLAYIASAGLGVIMGLIEEVRARGGDIRLTDLNSTLLDILELLGFSHLYRVFDSELEAIESYRRSS